MIDKELDIVIIGSGAGGGAVAKELAPMCADGTRIAVLERGIKLGDEDFNGREVEMAGLLYYDGGGVLTKDRSMTLAFGSLYGGSTVSYTGTSLVIPEDVLRDWGVPGLTWPDIRQRSEKYLRENNVHLLEEELINENNRLFKIGCERLGYRVEQFPVNIDGCTGAGICNLGCPQGAKQGTHRVQLPAAERQGVEVVTSCEVESIKDRTVVARVSQPERGEQTPWAPGEYRIKAGIVIVCGGAAATPALLIRSGLSRQLPMLGRYLTLHPALILVAEHEHPITNFYGHPKCYYSDQFQSTKRFLLETCFYFPFTTAKNLIGFGAAHSQLMRAFDRLQMILVLAFDEARPDNRIVLDRDQKPVYDYTLSRKVLDALHESIMAATRIFFAAGARRVHAPSASSFFIEQADQERLDELILRRYVKPGRISITSAHIMGGCRMGSGPADSVTDSWGQVHGLPWLHVADSSLFPRCSEVNPYVTVMALADRVAEGVRRKAPELLGG
jgi:choline dehydrogenase-like flavoprotein